MWDGWNNKVSVEWFSLVLYAIENIIYEDKPFFSG